MTSARSRHCTLGLCGALAALALRVHGAEPPAPTPEWPEDIGSVTATDRDRARAALRELSSHESRPERLAEARLRLALAELAPLPGRNVARARQGLTEATRGRPGDRWVAASRYALAWVEELEGSPDDARTAYGAIVADDPRSDAARRAGTAMGRLELRRDQPAEAAVWLQSVVDRGGAPGAQEYREAAIRGAVQAAHGSAATRTAVARSSVTELREATAMARSLSGDVIVADRKRGLVVRLAKGEQPVRTWPLAGVTALAVDPYGRIFAAAAETILRLDGESPSVVARTASFGGVSALAVDAAGRIWIADRRGDRVGIVRADAGDADIVRDRSGERVAALAWDGRNIVALQPAAGRVVALAPDGSDKIVVSGLAETPIGMSASGSGAVAVQDERGGIVVVTPGGKITERFDLRAAGVQRPGAIALGSDGSIDCFDAAQGRVVRLR